MKPKSLPRAIILCAIVIAACTTGCTRWKLTGPMASPRELHTATSLLDGSVLVTGGTDGTNVWSSAERYDPASGKWTAVASMHVPRVAHTATLLLDGRVLVVGGIQKITKPPIKLLDSAEIYDPVTNQWTTVAPMHFARAYHLADLLHDGRVIVASGGATGKVADQRSVELYNPATNTWASVGNTTMAHTQGTINRLRDGSILVAGGFEAGTQANKPPIDASNYSERYVPDTGLGQWGEVSVLNELPVGQAASLLQDGSVLLTGGVTPGGTVRSTIRYMEPATLASYQNNVWQYSQDMSSVRSRHTQTTLPDGTVLVVGGFLGCILSDPEKPCSLSTDLVEVFRSTNAISGVWTMTDYLNNSRGGHTANLMNAQCKILVAGGYDWTHKVALSSAELLPTPCLKPSPSPLH